MRAIADNIRVYNYTEIISSREIKKRAARGLAIRDRYGTQGQLTIAATNRFRSDITFK